MCFFHKFNFFYVLVLLRILVLLPRSVTQVEKQKALRSSSKHEHNSGTRDPPRRADAIESLRTVRRCIRELIIPGEISAAMRGSLRSRHEHHPEAEVGIGVERAGVQQIP